VVQNAHQPHHWGRRSWNDHAITRMPSPGFQWPMRGGQNWGWESNTRSRRAVSFVSTGTGAKLTALSSFVFDSKEHKRGGHNRWAITRPDGTFIPGAGSFN
jgi:hypothetical protein